MSKNLKEAQALRAADLKMQFGVYGYFYQRIIDGTEYACRSVLDLIDHNITPLDPNEILGMSPDVVTIMMNPGSSQPLGDYQPRLNDADMVPARPDITQYQVMKVMAYQGWRHCRIFNLSDFREPKSQLFMGQVESCGDDSHSIFCASRSRELTKLFPPDIPVILGWGRDERLLPLAKLCKKRIKERKVAGVTVDGESFLYAHPSPMLQKGKDAWLKAIVGMLNGNYHKE